MCCRQIPLDLTVTLALCARKCVLAAEVGCAPVRRTDSEGDAKSIGHRRSTEICPWILMQAGAKLMLMIVEHVVERLKREHPSQASPPRRGRLLAAAPPVAARQPAGELLG